MPGRNSAGRVTGNNLDRVPMVGIAVFSRSYRSALVSLLRSADGFEAADLGDGGEETERQLEHLRPDALLVDLPRRSLIPFVRYARRIQPGLVILAVNCDETEEELLPLFESGLSAFVPHEAGSEDLLDVLRAALGGEAQCSPNIVAALVRRLYESGGGAPALSSSGRLTPRENQVARHLEQGLSNKQISVRLGIEISTVKNHVHTILRKLEARRREEAVQLLQSQPAASLRLLRATRGARKVRGRKQQL